MPDCLQFAVADDGAVRVPALLGAILRRPGELIGLISMARKFGKARATLEEVARSGGEILATASR